MTQHTTQPLDAAALDRIARNYFAEEFLQQHVKHAIHDAFLEAGLIAQARAAQPAQSEPDFETWFDREYPIVDGRRPKYQERGVLALMGDAWDAARAAQAHHAAATTGNDARDAAANLLRVLDKHLYMNDYCGLQVDKQSQPCVTDAIENLRAAMSAPNAIQNNEGNTNE